MSAVLLDVNVLMALVWPSHEHHGAAHFWLRNHRGKWATCNLTQLAFVRLSSNPAVADPATTPQQAVELLQRMAEQPNHVYWGNVPNLAETLHWPPEWVRGHRQVTDAFLLAIAQRHKGKLATFDGALRNSAGAGLVELISKA